MAKQTALERHRRAAEVPIHEHVGLLAFRGWQPDAEVTEAQYRTALRTWRKAPVSGVRPRVGKPPAKPANPADKAKPEGGASGS